MRHRISRLAAGAVFAALGVSAVIAQGGAGAAAPNITVHPNFAVLHTAARSAKAQPNSLPPNWEFHYKYLGTKYQDQFIGTNPKSGPATTVPVDIIPVKLTSGSTVEDPTAGGSSSAVNKTLASPIFNSSIDYVQGGTNVGTTQYIDAFQRLDLWNKVKTNTNYHVLFGTPTVKPEVSFTVPAADGGVYTAFGIPVIVANINWFDPLIESVITADGIPATALPIFAVVDSYLSDNSNSSGCCIGGYHNYNGTQAYAEYTYFTVSGAFSQDVSALSHELGEYVDDPETNNTDVPAACGTHGNDQLIYEVGDPLEVEANYGDYAYTVGGVTWHLQDLVTPAYFGEKPSKVGNGSETFQGQSLSVCQNGG